MQENRTFDHYFGMLNPYRKANNFNIGDDGKEYDVDGIDDKLTTFSNSSDPCSGSQNVAGCGQSYSLFKLATACIDDETSDWLGSFGDISRYNFTPQRKIALDGFVHIAENYAIFCGNPTPGATTGNCSSQAVFSDLAGRRAMGYYDQGFLNYYYFMASQFALSDRWFSPVSSKSTPNRIATVSGGTTQGLVNDPFKDDGITSALAINTIFQELDQAKVSWKIYYSITQSGCVLPNSGTPSCPGTPDVTFADFGYAGKYLSKPPCVAPTVPSKAVGDPNSSYCIDPTHIAPISQYFTDVANGTLPNFAWIEPAYGTNDEHPGSGQSILAGQTQVAALVNALMKSPSWKDSVFFVSYDEGGGPFDHVPPVPKHTNDFTDAALGITTDISAIAVNPDTFFPCKPPAAPPPPPPPSLNCDLGASDPGANPGDIPVTQGFAGQLGFRLPNMVISPFTRRHYVSHIPMDHTAIIKFVESRFISPTAHLTNRDAVQPDLLDFFDFTNVPWATPPTPPAPTPDIGATCTPGTLQ